MAKKREIIITCDAKAVEDTLDFLKKSLADVKAKMDALNEKGSKEGWTTQMEKEFAELNKMATSINNFDIEPAKKKMRMYGEVMKDLAGSKTKDLKKALGELKRELDNMSARDPKRAQLEQDLKKIQRQIDKNTASTKSATAAQNGFSGALKTTLKNLVAYAGVFAIFGKIKSMLSDIVAKNKELSDSMANIRKVSQWAAADVEKLTENLAKIDTRNTITTLQNLAYQGAKLGIGQYGVEGLTGFVKAAEQVQTALGEDLGEQALPALAKLTEVMGLIPKYGVEQAMQKAGSAIYQLGASSTATGANIVEFTKRLMGLANVSGITADQLIALGSAADAMALMPEVASTAFNKIFVSIQGNTEGIAKAVGIAKEELEGLVYEGKTMEALVMVFEKMNKMSMKEMEGRGVFKALGSEGSRMTNVMVTMADKVDMLTKHLDISNKAFEDGTAIINEYLIQQETAAAYFERSSNIWAKAFINPEGVDIVKQLAQEWYNVSYEMTHSASTMASIKLTLELLAGTVKTLITYLPTLIKLMMFYGVGSVLQAVVVQFKAIYAASTMAGTGVARLNALLKTNAIALAATAVAMLIAKMYELSEASKAAAEEEEKRQRVFTDAAAEALQAYKEQAKALDKYKDALKQTNTSEEERNEIIRQFKNEFGSYLEKLGIEINTYKDMENALHRVNKELKDKAYYETGQKLRESYVGDAKSEQTNALSQYMQTASRTGISTDVMQQIVEGKAGTRQEAIVKAFESTKNGKMLGKLYSQLSENGITYNALSDDVREFVKQQYGSGRSIGIVWDSLKDVANAAGKLYDTSQEVNKREDEVTKFLDQYADKYSPQISVDGAILNLKRLKELNEEKLNEGLNVLRDAWKEMSENERKADKRGIKGAIDQYSTQLRSMRGEGYTPPPTDKELRDAKRKEAQAQREAKDAARKEMQDAQKESTGVLSKLEEWYRLQEAAITEARADGKMTEEQAAQMVNTLNIIKNESLATARRAITTGDTAAWDELKTNIMPKAMADASDLSKNLLETIQNVPVQVLHDNLAKFNGDAEKVFGLDSRAFFDQINAKAAGNTREAARLRAKLFKQAEKLLEQYEIVRVAQKKMQTDLEGIGIVTETYEEFAYRMQNGITEKQPKTLKNGKTITDEEAYAQMGAKFIGQGTIPYRINIENADEALQWIQDFATTAQGELEDWAQAFPYVEQWVTLLQRKAELQKEGKDLTDEELVTLQEAIPTIKAMFYQLETSANNVAETIKKQVEVMTGRKPIGINEMGQQHAAQMSLTSQLYDEKINEANASGDVDAAVALEEQKKQALIDLEYQYQQELWSIREKMGADVFEQYENEVAQYKNMLDKKLISEKQFQQQKGKLQMKLGLNVAQQYNTMMSDMVNALQEAEIASVEAKYDAEINAAKAAGQDTTALEEQKEAEVLEIRKKYAGLQFAIKISEIIANTAVAIMQAYAQLGPIAGSIAAAMLTATGAAQVALAKAEYDKVMGMQAGGSKASTSSSNTKTKLVSGMLTYDKGNVKRFVGQDGKVYTATEEAQPKDGLVTHPIATTVQGQPALVAENGPEIVVGRETTKAIMMNEPELIRYLANYQQHGGRYLPYDSGNVSEYSEKSEYSDSSATAERQALINRLDRSDELMAQVLYYLQNPIPPEIAMYDTGGKKGLHSKMKEANSFMARYGG